MARTIPNDQPLSDEDREYLLIRGKVGLIEHLDREFPSKSDEPEEEVQPASQQPVEEDFLEDDEDDEDDGPVYENLAVADLKAELKRRGLSPDGKKDDLVSRLYNDDK